ncbi:hypothetical protein [Streptomyces sp. NPDC057580]|uniref:hypothetical protein n=1 Tax=Streptomyces sp. NPDC057580 TaxID=3346173 RepID=UPI0036AAA13B
MTILVDRSNIADRFDAGTPPLSLSAAVMQPKVSRRLKNGDGAVNTAGDLKPLTGRAGVRGVQSCCLSSAVL